MATKAMVLAKIEGRNPAASVKCRIGAAMVWDAEKSGVLTAGKELIEATSGNTGIALAFVGAARGYRVTLTMPDTMSVERRKVLQALGAKLVLTDGAEGMAASIEKAEEIVASDPQRFVMLQQFKNPANPLIHFRTTGPEIWGDTEGSVDILVSGIAHRRHYQRRVALHQEGKRKENSLGGRGAGQQRGDCATPRRAMPLRPGPHKVQGIGAGFIPDTLDLSYGGSSGNRVTNEESIGAEWRGRLAKQEGILAGISCGLPR